MDAIVEIWQCNTVGSDHHPGDPVHFDVERNGSGYKSARLQNSP